MYRLVVLAGLAGCPADPPPECTTIDTSCAPGYVPNFTNVYNNTLAEGCASTRSCHSATGKAGDLVMSDQQTAYDQLLDAAQDRVRPGDPACSELIVRVHGIDEDYQMPPGNPVPVTHRCALVHWVLQGAQP